MMNIKNKKTILFGAGKIGKGICEELKASGVCITYFCDNDSKKWGNVINEIEVINPDKLSEMDNFQIIITSIYKDEIKQQLFDMDIKNIVSKEKCIAINNLYFPDERNKMMDFLSNIYNSNAEISIVVLCENQRISNGVLDNLKTACENYQYEIVAYRGKNTIIHGNKIVIVNENDYVQPNWLENLLSIYNQLDGKCIVGSQIVDLNGNIICAGQILWKEGIVENYCYYKNYLDCESSYVRQVDAIPTSGMLMSKENWNIWVDSDDKDDYQERFCVKMHKLKIPIMYQPDSIIVSDRMESKFKELDLHTECWREFKDFFENSSGSIHEGKSLKSISRKQCFGHMLLVDNEIPKYDTNAGGRTVDQYLEIFLKMNMQIIILPDNYSYCEKYMKRYQQKGIFVIYGEDWSINYKEYLDKYVNELNYAFLNRPEESLKYVDLLRVNKKIRISYYGMDIHYMRFMRQYELTQDKQYYEKSKEMELIENEIIQKVDYAGYPSQLEVDILKEKFPDKEIQYYPVFYYPEREFKKRANENRGLLFVGGFRHRPNVDGVLWFINDVLPILKKNGFFEKIYLVGSYPPNEVINLQSENIVVTGYIDDYELEKYYNTCRVAIAPLRFGAGIKGKVIEALYEGIPIVTTDIGAEGINLQEVKLSIANSAEHFAFEIKNIYDNDTTISEYSISGQEYVRKRYGEQQLYDLFKSQIEGK